MKTNEESKDYCGPAGDSWLSRLISKLVPDTVLDVYLGGCCKQHDAEYSDSDRRKNADKHFRSCIKCRFRAKALATGANVYKFLGTLVAGWYYVGVRLGGWLCHDDKDPS